MAARDGCSTFFFPTGQHSSRPQPITHFIDATATRRHQLISCSGRQSNSPGFGSHSHYTGQGKPAASRLWDRARCLPRKARRRWAAHPQKGLCCPRWLPCFFGAGWQNSLALWHQTGKGNPRLGTPWCHSKSGSGSAAWHIVPTGPAQHSPAWPGGCWSISQKVAGAPRRHRLPSHHPQEYTAQGELVLMAQVCEVSEQPPR